MSISRKWPVPPMENTLHCIGDLHVQVDLYEYRRDFMLRDLSHPTMPDLPVHLQLGDFANTGLPNQYERGKAFMKALGGDWLGVVGNHDIWTLGDSGNPRNADLAAADMGMPSANFTVDLGYAVLIILGPKGGATTYDPAFLDTALTANSDRICLVAAHAPLKETVGVGSGTDVWRSIDADGFFTTNDSAMRAVLEDHDNAKAWICGHTHSPLTDNYFVKPEVIGGHTLAHINTSAIAYTGRTAEWYDRVASVFVTTHEDSIDVRFRDHGSHSWVGGSDDSKRIWSIDF